MRIRAPATRAALTGRTSPLAAERVGSATRAERWATRAGRAGRRLARSTLLRAGGTAAGIALLVHGADLRGAATILVSAHGGWLVAGALLAGAAFLSAIVEWGVWLRAASRRVTWSMVSSWQAQSVFLGTVLPTGAGGDALRVAEAVRVAGGGRGVASLLGSRLAGASGMAAWGVVGALTLSGSRLGGLGVAAATVVAGLLAAAWAAALLAGPAVRRLAVHRRRWLRRLGSLARPLTDALGWYRGCRGVVAASLAAGAAGWGLHLLSVEALGRAVGVDVSPALLALLVPVALLATLAPFTVNGLGLREGLMVALLGRWGVEPHHAAVLALLLDLQALPVALLGAALWLARRPGRRSHG
jgi:glycosyltransferase 2 family protein